MSATRNVYLVLATNDYSNKITALVLILNILKEFDFLLMLKKCSFLQHLAYDFYYYPAFIYFQY